MVVNQANRRTSTCPPEIDVRHSAEFIRKAASGVLSSGPPSYRTKIPIAPKTEPNEIGMRRSAEFIRKAASGVLSSGPPSNGMKNPIGPKTELQAGQAVGLLLLDSSLNPISCNDETIHILSYPHLPENIRRLDVFLTDTIRGQLLSRQSPQDSRFVTEFVSGKRRYRIRVFHLNWHAASPSHSALALLFDRGLSRSLLLPHSAQQFNFSRREQEVVEFLLQGLSSKEIADRMKISPNTVNTFFKLIMIKMGVCSRSGILAKMIAASFDDGSVSLTPQ
jgi:DNA-binding CsgD family transcriptional regulator